MVGIQDYINKTQQGKPTPKDPYSHATFLISSEEDKILEFHQLVNKEVLLANISNDQLLKYYQRDITILTDLFGMALRDKDMLEVFLIRYYGWIGELSVTRTKDGLERKMQGSTGQSSYSPQGQMMGLGIPTQQNQQPEKVSILKRFFPGQRQPQQQQQQY